MQVTLLFTVYDSKAEIYLPPFFCPTAGIATRAFSDCVNSEEHQFGKHPGDYTLFFLGEFNDQDASFALKNPTSVGNGVEFLTPTTSGADHDPRDTPILTDKNGGDTS